VVNHNLEDQMYLSVVTSIKKIIDIAKIRTNFHELHSETQHWKSPKHHGKKESVTFFLPSGLKMEITFSYNSLCIPKLDPNFLIFVTIPTFLTFQVIKTLVIFKGFSYFFLSIEIIF
jgi:hypothetical protein